MKKLNMLTILSLSLAVIGATFSAQGQTYQPPERMTYQGFLVDGNGSPLGTNAPKNYDVVFAIYAADTGGTSLWTEQQTVTVDKGYFSVLLGEGTAIGLHPALSTVFTGINASDRYIGITVKGIGAGGSDVNILPRIRFLTSPYSFMSRNTANIVGSTGAVLVTTSGSAVQINGAITATNFSGSGAGLTGLTSNQIPNLPAAILNSGTLDINRIPSLNASIIGAGTLADARLSANVPLLNAANNFVANQTISASLGIGKAPGATLDVSGSVTFTNTGARYSFASFSPSGGKVLVTSLTGVDSNGPQSRLSRQSSLGWVDTGLNGNGEYVVEVNDVETLTVSTNYTVYAKGNLIANASVGIGTTTIAANQARLQIAGSPTRASTGIAVYWAQQNVTTWSGTTDPGGVTSISADGRIYALGYVSHSDERIKNIIGLSDGASDLNILARLKITDYLFKDTVEKGNHPQKKLIAQQVEQIYPQAVNKDTGVVPDIYKIATNNNGWVSLATDLKAGDRVRLIGETGEGIYDVLEATPDQFRTSFIGDGAEVFVYGREVKDFRSLDYEAISMLNVSATQELAKRLAAKSAQADALEHEVSDLKERLAELEQLVKKISTSTSQTSN